MVEFLSKFIKLNTINVVGILKKDNEEVYHLLSIKKKGDKMNIISTNSFAAFEDLLKNLDAKIPILLNIDGKGVLNKTIDFNNEVDLNWHKHIDFSTIYHTSLKSGNNNFISFCRKNIVNSSIKKFKDNRYTIVDIYIGSFLSALLHNALKINIIKSGELELEFDDNQLIHFKKITKENDNREYKIGNEIISNDFLPLYGTIIHFFLQQKEVSKTKNETLNIEEIIYKKTFNILGTVMLVGFLISLLISYILIQYYGSKNIELNLKNVYSNQSYQIILDLEKQKENKLNILKQSGFLSSKFLSFFSYEIIKNTPSDISLSELNINPLVKKIKINKKIDFEVKTIKIKGETYNETSFSNWIQELKRTDWIEHFEIISLKKDKTNKSLFELKITIKDV